ncbi:MAG: PQQ-binding-like beta-propeller repeat protein [Pseudomonadales bacterium]|nr:PQQ-binding-like beta-propeller repeat protein [Pseudomonadales bacterium]
MKTQFLLFLCKLALFCFIPALALGQQGSSGNEWASYGGDSGHSKYSPLDQINADNVQRLEVAWTWNSVDEEIRRNNEIIRDRGSFRSYAYEVTPLVVNGVLYTTTSLGQIAAIDPASGETLWSFDPVLYVDGRPAVHGFMTRGLAYWTDGEQERLYYAGGRTYLLAIDPATGRLDPQFGRGGRVDLKRGLGRTIDPSLYAVSSPPIVVGDVVVVGSAMTEGTDFREAPPGHVRGFNVHTGETQWIFHTIPQPGEFGADTWPQDAWRFTGGANVWTMMSADEELGLVYLPVGTTVPDYYGGHRLGDNLFANSLVALNAETGERVWHYQMVHHSVWDYDPPAAPNLIDIVVDGQAIKAVAQITKQGFTFVFDRVTGEPVWPIEEQAVPQSRVLGEITSPTQPFPTKPPLFLANGATEDDLIDFTPEIKAEALEIFQQYNSGPLYTPPAPGDNIIRPGWSGGANWWGAAFDPESQRLFVPSWAHFSTVNINPPETTDSDLTIRPRVRDLSGPRGLPLFKPPYSQLVAFDMNAGEKLWHVPVGEGPRDHADLQGLELPALGNFEKLGGPLLTKSLLFIGQGFETNRLGVYDKDSGEEIWWLQLPARFHATPITYMANGKQYIVFALGGGARGEPEQLMALSLP